MVYVVAGAPGWPPGHLKGPRGWCCILGDIAHPHLQISVKPLDVVYITFQTPLSTNYTRTPFYYFTNSPFHQFSNRNRLNRLQTAPSISATPAPCRNLQHPAGSCLRTRLSSSDTRPKLAITTCASATSRWTSTWRTTSTTTRRTTTGRRTPHLPQSLLPSQRESQPQSNVSSTGCTRRNERSNDPSAPGSCHLRLLTQSLVGPISSNTHTLGTVLPSRAREWRWVSWENKLKAPTKTLLQTFQAATATTSG